MKIFLYILILLFVLPFTGLAQNNSITNINKDAKFKNQIDLDVEVLAFSFSYKRRIAEKWLVGTTFGLGLSYNLITPTKSKYSIFSTDVVFEIYHLGVVFQYYKTEKLQFEIEPRIYYLSNFEFETGQGFIGVGFGIYYGKKIQIGFKTNLGIFEYNKGINDFHPFLSSSLLIRIPIKW